MCAYLDAMCLTCLACWSSGWAALGRTWLCFCMIWWSTMVEDVQTWCDGSGRMRLCNTQDSATMGITISSCCVPMSNTARPAK